MTNVTPGSDKERAWVEDHQRHHHGGEVINATTPSSSGFEHVEPEYDVEIPRPAGTRNRKLIPLVLRQWRLFIAPPAPLTVCMAINVTRVVGAERAPAPAVS